MSERNDDLPIPTRPIDLADFPLGGEVDENEDNPQLWQRPGQQRWCVVWSCSDWYIEGPERGSVAEAVEVWNNAMLLMREASHAA